MVGVPGETYSGSWSAVLESVNLFVDPALIETVLHRPYSEGLVLAAVRRLHVDKTIKHLMAALLEDVVAGSPAGPLLGETIVAAILRRLHAAGPSLPGAPGARLSPHELGVLRTYVHENLAATLHLNDLADCLDLSVRHFCRTLRATVGMAPHQYVIHCRLEHARQLLAARAMSFDEIAEVCGFADRRHMSSTFRRVLGITPLQSRNTSQQSPAGLGAAA
ncbi:MAG: helix-turn-helix transcriptional regulator [Janthinobacterium lividum]